jgi:hypothetical protein
MKSLSPTYRGAFLACLAVAALLAAERPAAEAVIGFKPGTDRMLADHRQVLEFYRRLDAASDRVQVFSIGTSAEGREMILAAISSEQNLAKLPRYREIARQLADSRGLTDDAARALAREGKAFVWVDFGLHATEVAHAQVSPELAYELATSDREEARRIRDQVVALFVPVMNPDGLDIVATWYRRNVGGPFETSPLPVLYQKHAGHDNNRDWFMQNLPETRNVTRQLYREWQPQILYNQHQSGVTSPRIWAPPMDEPANPNMHPLVNRGINLLGVAIMQRLEQEGKRGAQGYSTYSNWWNGGMRSTPCFHNIVGILTETASGRYATPVELTDAQLPQTLSSGESATLPSIWNPSPWRGGVWRLRDQMDYMSVATWAVLRIGAEYREDWLYNRYQMARDHVAAGTRGDPFAYVIPPEQHDWPTAVKLADILLRGAVELHQAKAPFTADGRTYPAGSVVALMAQPHRGFVKDLLEPQRHPDRREGPGGPPRRPYDMAGWTLSYQMGVRTDLVKTPFTAELTPLTDAAALRAGRVDATGEGQALAFDRRSNDAVRAAMQLLAAGARVRVTPAAFIVDGPGAADRVKATATSLGLVARAASGEQGRLLRAPRVGLFKSHIASMDEGWTRFVLEQFEVPYTSATIADIRKGDLRARYDALILPDQSVEEIVNGHAEGVMPPEYVGGIGLEGVMALKAFVEAGGALVALDGATALPIQFFGLPVANALDGVRNTEFYCPGSLLRLQIDVAHPLNAGMPAEQAGFFVNGRAFDLVRREGAGPGGVRALARYADKDLLMSGWINGERRIAGKAAAVEATLGRGRVVLIGFGAQFRGQPHGTFKMLLNPLVEAAAAQPAGSEAESR